MPLPDDYLVYPKRQPGPDHERYAASPYRERPALTLPNGAKVALWVTVMVEFFPLNPPAKPFKAPGGMVTPYPDLRHYTSRDYGNRVGIYRLLDLFARLNVAASFAVNAAVAERYPGLVAAIINEGHEVIAHGVDMAHVHHSGLSEGEEAALIERTLTTFVNAAGIRPKGWLSPARAQSWKTPDLIRAAGFEACLDWPNDTLPYDFETEHGPLTALPLTNELDDWQILMTYKRGEHAFAQEVEDAYVTFADEAERFGGQVLSVALRPYLSGLPYRIQPLEALLSRLLEFGADPILAGPLTHAYRASRG